MRKKRGVKRKGERRFTRRQPRSIISTAEETQKFPSRRSQHGNEDSIPYQATLPNAENSCGARFHDRPSRSTRTWRYQHQLDAAKMCKRAQASPRSPHKRLVAAPLLALTGSPPPRTAASCPDDRRGHWTNSESPLATLEVSKQRTFPCATHQMGQPQAKGRHR